MVAALCSLGAAHADTLFMGAYPNSLLVVDEDTGALTERIPLQTGLPVSLRLSNDKKLLYVVTNTRSGIEVIDTATRKVVNSLTLNTPTVRYRFSGGAVDPAGRYFYTVVTKIEKTIDRYTVSKPMYAAIDLQTKEIVRTKEVDAQDENANRGGGRNLFVVSDDGKSLYQFRDQIVIIDPATFNVVERKALSLPQTTGYETITIGGSIDALGQPGQYVSLFNAQDPYINNRIFGVARFNLDTREVNFTPVGPTPGSMSGFQVTPDGKTAYTVVRNGGNTGNQRCEFWRFDMATKAIQQRGDFECKTRLTLGMSGNGQKLYIYGATFDVEVYDAQTMAYEKTWDLENDVTGAGMVIVD